MNAGIRIILLRFASPRVPLPNAAQGLWLRVIPFLLGELELLLQVLMPLVSNAVGFFLRDAAELEQPLQVRVADGRPLPDGPVHQRLGEARLVRFVVPPAAITVH